MTCYSSGMVTIAFWSGVMLVFLAYGVMQLLKYAVAKLTAKEYTL